MDKLNRTNGMTPKRMVKPWSKAPGENLVLIVFLALLLSVSTAGAADKNPPIPGPKDKCRVCGMLVAPFPNWLSAVIFKDGSHAFFDGSKDMFKYIFDLKRYNPSKQTGDIETVFVTDYYKVTQVDGRKAWYVAGSNVNGPMGSELIPFQKESDARAFLKDHKGKQVLTFKEVTPEIVGIQDDHGGHGQDGHKGHK